MLPTLKFLFLPITSGFVFDSFSGNRGLELPLLSQKHFLSLLSRKCSIQMEELWNRPCYILFSVFPNTLDQPLKASSTLLSLDSTKIQTLGWRRWSGVYKQPVSKIYWANLFAEISDLLRHNFQWTKKFLGQKRLGMVETAIAFWISSNFYRIVAKINSRQDSRGNYGSR